MKKLLVVTALALICAGSGTVAIAEHHEEAPKDRYVALWYCKVNEGKTIDDVKAANSKWVAHVNASVEGGDVHSYILTPVVGKQGGFMYADSFPSIDAWQGSREAMLSEEGKAIEKELDEVADCSSNSLHQSAKS